jgi:hypothetical protein
MQIRPSQTWPRLLSTLLLWTTANNPAAEITNAPPSTAIRTQTFVIEPGNPDDAGESELSPRDGDAVVVSSGVPCTPLSPVPAVTDGELFDCVAPAYMHGWLPETVTLGVGAPSGLAVSVVTA